MYFKFSNGYAKKGLILICLLASLQPSVSAKIIEKSQLEQNNTNNQLLLSHIDFSAQPANCIALRHGRTCYANVTLNWSSSVKQDYCIYTKPEKNKQQQMINCWKNSKAGQVIFNFESNKKVEFQLISSKDKRVIAETSVEVSWVHKATPRKRHWRIF
jgi:hypothetical protein